MDVPTEGHYGANSFFDGMDELQMFEFARAPQHEPLDFVKAMSARNTQDNELLRQVKRYGKEQLNPALGVDTSTNAQLPDDVYHRSFVLKPKGARSDPKLRKKEPTERLRRHLKIVTKKKDPDAAR